jgi:hypothetical protein
VLGRDIGAAQGSRARCAPQTPVGTA